MKTPQEEIQFIVENTDGECLHDYDGDGTIYDPKICTKCGVNRRSVRNPSPHSLDDLVRLAEKNGFYLMTMRFGDDSYQVRLGTAVDRKPIFADALRNALVKAIEGNQ